MLYASDFRRIAREALTHRWAVAVVTGFIVGFFGVTSGYSLPSFQWTNDSREIFQSEFDSFELLIMFAILAYIMVWVLIQLFLGGVITLGYARFNKNLIERTNPQFSDLFSRFDLFWKGFLMQLLMGLYTVLWTLLFIIPGIIASYSYAMTPYILEENPNMTANEAIGYSKEMMRGNKWRLFCLDISFIGWAILCLLTCGIGYFLLTPYIYAAHTAFFYEVSGKFNTQNAQWGNQNQYNGWMQ